ncbi:class I SAM-dependent methyltransferase [Streptomyces sp. ET3-23]|uniref:class I SAM-dependent methyltransferase n=1 Tax=Streptomyces sp. ET3-23 TaxID=2885643 RepID=UPI001D12C601|nr:class I SAM-dependent methyltransferase [Streptomyces sp. ET3-23]MCC2275453.1 class I SAM-dependent methyltransferase [Streptomyces sp. ET3-23]
MTTSITSPSAAVWNAWEAEGRSYQLITDRELLLFTQHFPIRGGHIAVDVGCGSGGFTRQLHRFGYDVTGIDFADAALNAARRTPLSGVRYIRHDLNKGDPLNLRMHGIDLVVCRLAMPFLTDPVSWIRRVRDSWLRPGGRMYAVIPVVGDDIGRPGGMTERELAPLTLGWAQAVRYNLRGPLACLALRSTAT